jgi:hypothetical protein
MAEFPAEVKGSGIAGLPVILSASLGSGDCLDLSLPVDIN